jgi:hypothetical protein
VEQRQQATFTKISILLTGWDFGFNGGSIGPGFFWWPGYRPSCLPKDVPLKSEDVVAIIDLSG